MKKSLFLLLSIFNFLNLKSQTLPLPQNIQSPNATSLGLYGDVPISYYHGTPNISVPLYEINEGQIPLNISLNYNSSGVMVNSVPGWVGQNWSLNAGGVITRAIKGNPDEMNFSLIDYGPNSQQVEDASLGYLYTHSDLLSTRWSNQNYIENLLSEDLLYPPNGGTPKRDYQPDIFTFNFMGHTGKFFLGQDGEWKVSSQSNLKISIEENDFLYPPNKCEYYLWDIASFDSSSDPIYGPCRREKLKTIGTITIKDDKGNTYVFGDEKNNIEYTLMSSILFQLPTTSGSSIDYQYANSWYLKEVRNKLNQVVYNFEYERYHNYSTAQFFLGGSTIYHEFDSSGFTSSCINSYSDINLSTLPAAGKLIFPTYLKKIETRSGKVLEFIKDLNFSKTYNFNSGSIRTAIMNQANWLHQKWGSNTSVIKFDLKNMFYYLHTKWGAEELNPNFKNYNLSNAYGIRDCIIDWLESELKTPILKSISTNFNKDIRLKYNLPLYPGATTNPERLFLEEVHLNYVNFYATNHPVYKFEYFNKDLLPDYTSRATDHWGYYNGTSSNASGTIEGTNTFNNYYNNRNTNDAFSSYGALTKIIYPTKGFTTFDWESNTYSKYVKDDFSGIEQVTNTLAGGLRIHKITNYSSDDIPINSKTYSYTIGNSTNSSGILEHKPKYYWDSWNMITSAGTTYLKKIFSLTPQIPLSNIFGSHIGYSEVKEELLDGSYTKYLYTSNNNANYRDTPYVNTFNLDISPLSNHNDKSLIRGKLAEVEFYNNRNEIQRTTRMNYSYDISKNIRGNDVIKEKVCPLNSVFSYIGNSYNIYYFDMNMINEEDIIHLETGDFITNTENSWFYHGNFGDSFIREIKKSSSLGNDIINSEEFKYTFDNDFPFRNQLKNNRELNVFQTSFFKNNIKTHSTRISYDSFGSYILPNKTQKSKGQLPFQDEMVIYNYDVYGNPTEVSKKDGTHIVYIWGYNETQLVAKIENATLSDIPANIITNIKNLSNEDDDSCLDSQSCDEKNLRIALNNLRDFSTLTKAQITTYTYNPLIGVTSITDPRGETVYYQYDNFNRLQFIKDSNGNIVKEHKYNYKN
ncbi:RHS repeat domain-containing protein [Aquimarina rhabdastrellae]